MPAIDAVALDVDGVLTDGTFLWSATGEESKRFSFRDIMGISLAKKAGIEIALISGEDSAVVHRYAQKMNLVHIFLGCKQKDLTLHTFSERIGIPPERICFMGDDVNDLPAMRLCGLAAAPANAHPSVLAQATFISSKEGGFGAVRELLDTLILQRELTSSRELL
jgi:3-deoxy-D-manno-octulosonate 8-phosphate phosphatase (KDO 8-P phosphatase)